VHLDINARGDVVRWYRAGTTERGYLWSNGACTTIDYDGAVLTNAGGINDEGDIVGLYLGADGHYHGCLGSRFGEFTTIDGPNANNGKPTELMREARSWASTRGATGNGTGSCGVAAFSVHSLTQGWTLPVPIRSASAPMGQKIVGVYRDPTGTPGFHGFLLTRKPLE
jgi:hypothetical protein